MEYRLIKFMLVSFEPCISPRLAKGNHSPPALESRPWRIARCRRLSRQDRIEIHVIAAGFKILVVTLGGAKFRARLFSRCPHTAPEKERAVPAGRTANTNGNKGETIT